MAAIINICNASNTKSSVVLNEMCHFAARGKIQPVLSELMEAELMYTQHDSSYAPPFVV